MATWKKVIVSGSDAELNKLTVTNGITGSLRGTASYADSSSITYVSNSMYGLSEIEVADYDNNVAVTYVNGRLKFIFGTPVAHAISSFSDGVNLFLVDRFTTQTDSYNLTGNWANNGYTFTQARIMQGASVIASTTTANSTTLSATGLSTTGNQTYVLEVSASNPLTSTIVPLTQTLTLTVSKTLAGVPTITPTPTVQLNAASNQIEQGATGSIAITSNTGSANSWTLTSFAGTGSYGAAQTGLFGTSGTAGSATYYVTGSTTGSSIITLQATASYNTNALSSPETSSIRNATSTYSKIRSIRYGTIASNLTASLSQSFLENLALWDTTLGGTIGTIVKGTIDPGTAGYTCPSLTTAGNHFIFVVDYNISGNVLNSITNTGANLNDIANFTTVNVNNTYRVYYSTNPSAATITYKIAR